MLRSYLAVILLALCAALPGAHATDYQTRPRARDLGVAPGVFEPGRHNAITDVDGVRVGHTTLIEGDRVRTGVTAVLPHGGNLFQEKVPGAVYVGNAFGKLAGSTQVEELGAIETPIVLTNTLAVGTAVDAVVKYSLAEPGNEEVRSVNALVGETNDGGLNDIRSQPVTTEHVLAAIRSARGGAVAEGCVGAGTGCEAFGFKGGVGTSSRRLPQEYGGWTVGVLVQANFGGVLSIDGVPVAKRLGRYAFRRPPRAQDALPAKRERLHPASQPQRGGDDSGDGSCMIVVATDAPLDARELKRLAARAIFGLARTGSSYTNGSGDYAISFSTAQAVRVPHETHSLQPRSLVPTDSMSPLFQAALEATEEAVYNALLQATTTTSSGRRVEALPVEVVESLISAHRDAMDRSPKPQNDQ